MAAATEIEICVPAMPAHLIATAAQFLDELIETSGLPEVYDVTVTYRRGTKTWNADAMVLHHLAELDRIDAVREWAVALDGTTRLGTPFKDRDRISRRFSAVAQIPGGGTFEIRTYLDCGPNPAPED